MSVADLSVKGFNWVMAKDRIEALNLSGWPPGVCASQRVRNYVELKAAGPGHTTELPVA